MYTTSETKELVSLRKRKMRNGGYSLLLDYMINGVRTRESLKMYLVPEKTKIDKVQNQETLKAANAAKARRIIEIQQGKVGIRRKKSNILLSDYFKKQEEEYTKRGKAKYAENLRKIAQRLHDYRKDIPIQSINKDYVVGFIDHLRSTDLAESTAHMYYANFNTILNNAYREGLIDENPASRVDKRLRLSAPESLREYLTIDEVRALANTQCADDNVKRAFLFACFSGLRLSDIEALTWDKIKRSASGWQVEARQIKTARSVFVPLSRNAMKQLPKRSTGKVFKLKGRVYINQRIKEWVEEAGIEKTITFHCSRHTNATLLLAYGADIYTVSRLLGHTDIATTQIYAKIVDENKRKAVDNIPLI